MFPCSALTSCCPDPCGTVLCQPLIVMSSLSGSCVLFQHHHHSVQTIHQTVWCQPQIMCVVVCFLSVVNTPLLQCLCYLPPLLCVVLVIYFICLVYVHCCLDPKTVQCLLGLSHSPCFVIICVCSLVLFTLICSVLQQHVLIDLVKCL